MILSQYNFSKLRTLTGVKNEEINEEIFEFILYFFNNLVTIF